MSTVARHSGAPLRRSIPAAEFEEIYLRLFMPLVRRVAKKHDLSKEDARDVVQDAFALGFVKLRADGNPRSWLISAVDHLAVNLKRTAARREDLMSKWMPAGLSIETKDESPFGSNDEEA